jgi:hypothetical protein
MELPLDALEAVVALREELDLLEAEAVREARLRGATWERIAQALAVTRQAAHLRHVKADGGTREAD